MGKVAPHLNCEVRLVLSGTKPIAAIERDKDPYGYAMAVALSSTGALKAYKVKGEVIIVLPKNSKVFADYVELLAYGVRDFGIKEYHRKMGKMFGYTDEDTEAFIKAEIKCNCTKCTGEPNDGKSNCTLG